MAAANLLSLIDDIASLLDDVAILSKVAAKKTAGVLGDDLALNAHQVSGVLANRELPVVWAVAKGSLLNKVILVPAALLIGAVTPWMVTVLLILGGAYLCFEGFEKLAHRFLHPPHEDQAHHGKLVAVLSDPLVSMVAFEKQKIKGAIRTDFVLSAEIVVITLGTVAAYPLATRIAVVCSIAAAMTLGVYGLVAGIVKLDDLGLYLHRQRRTLIRLLGWVLLVGSPYLMKILSLAGTVAMFLVGGGIFIHGFSWLREWTESLIERATVSLDPAWAWSGLFLEPLLCGVVGIAAGALVLLLVSVAKKFVRALRPS